MAAADVGGKFGEGVDQPLDILARIDAADIHHERLGQAQRAAQIERLLERDPFRSDARIDAAADGDHALFLEGQQGDAVAAGVVGIAQQQVGAAQMLELAVIPMFERRIGVEIEIAPHQGDQIVHHHGGRGRAGRGGDAGEGGGDDALEQAGHQHHVGRQAGQERLALPFRIGPRRPHLDALRAQQVDEMALQIGALALQRAVQEDRDVVPPGLADDRFGQVLGEAADPAAPVLALRALQVDRQPHGRPVSRRAIRRARPVQRQDRLLSMEARRAVAASAACRRSLWPRSKSSWRC